MFLLTMFEQWVNLTDDEFRFEYGTPDKNGDYAFAAHSQVPEKHGQGGGDFATWVLFRGNARRIRQNLVRQGYIKGIIGLPTYFMAQAFRRALSSSTKPTLTAAQVCLWWMPAKALSKTATRMRSTGHSQDRRCVHLIGRGKGSRERRGKVFRQLV